MPDDTTPHGGEAMHTPPDRARIPQPKPGRESDEPPRGQPTADEPQARPPLPDRTEPMAADVEDEDADPVIESGPGVDEDTGVASVTQQPGA
jgi:hypothetical protein